MLKLVRVILSADIERFRTGIGRAGATFRGFVSDVQNGVLNAAGAIGSLAQGWFFLKNAISDVANIAKAVFDTFLSGAIDMERAQFTLGHLAGSADQAQQMMDILRQKSTQYGVSLEGLLPSAQQVAVALRAQEGAIDTGKWEELTNQVLAFMALRPDVPVQFWGRAISGFLSGDTQTLTRLLDINVRDIATLSDEARAFLTTTQTAQEQQLGQVTRLGGQAQASGDAAMAALREVANAVGATEDLLSGVANTTAGKMAVLQARFDDLKRQLGADLLPIVNEILDKLLTFLEDHQDEMYTLIDKLAKFSGEEWQKLADALNSVDWAAIADAIGTFVDFMSKGGPAGALTGYRGNPETSLLHGLLTGQPVPIGPPGSPVTSQNVAPAVQGALQISTPENIGVAGGWEALLNGLKTLLGQQEPQRLEVVVTSNNEMFDAHVQNISRREAQQAANQAVGAVVTGSTQQKRGR